MRTDSKLPYIVLRAGVRQYPRRGPLPPLPNGYERDPQDKYTIRPILESCVYKQKYQPTNTCCAGERDRCKQTGKDVTYYTCAGCKLDGRGIAAL